MMKHLPYPPDGGLKNPVREFKDTFSAITVIMKHFFPEKFENDNNQCQSDSGLDKS